MRLRNFNGKYRYYAYTRLPQMSDQLLARGLHVMLHNGMLCALLPEAQCFLVTQDENDSLQRLSDGDVLRNVAGGRLDTVYEKTSNDNAIIVTQKCNSNCIMCPVPEVIRKTDEAIDIDDLIEQTRYIPDHVEHITITGGEPFIAGRGLFQVFRELKDCRDDIEYLLLTNGRAFADTTYAREFNDTQPSQITVGIPIHGADAATHDWITQSSGGFEQTVLGIQHLLYLGCCVEIRFVISKLNAGCITQMARMVASEFNGINSVKFMGLEMTGNAATHIDDVWISYADAFDASRLGIDLLMAQGITVELYNFPLCMVDPMYWPLCRRSISGYKVRYKDDCSKCLVKDACGGMFLGTQRLVDKVIPVITENGRV